MKQVFRLFLICCCLLIVQPLAAAVKNIQTSSEPQLMIIDSWLTGYFGGFFRAKEKRFKQAWKTANHRAKSDARIWGGLFVSDSTHSGYFRFGEVISRFTYQAPQTAAGFLTAQWYNTVLGKVNTVEYAFGATSLNMRVDWLGVTLGNYILADTSINGQPDNRMFQHEYGHYLQSKRMGFAYFVRVGLPAIMSKGDHDTHPVEVDCNRRAFLYFNQTFPEFQNDSLLADTKGWNFRFNPFPDTLNKGIKRQGVCYVDYKDSLQVSQLETLRIKPTFIDYASWIILPVGPVVVGMIHARKYNKIQLKAESPKIN
ncbi:MAG: hypothetical protein A3D31_07910 [Candidatus Fluviicola riflensis]|nr:MAG: hypothetical protein CHH17_07100 [Candidatus Fluviicola riflensis]OGS79868.1 MAG: hypothetical protein A3D31_07910 [Candidatus Fluviicola riflensis]OGS82383.1 MAG: hypothetical protein A2724_16855 [Fluviicola sp. RIFCSPHIGHO2_01_FULL_43_53]OGS88047.1 MAG: hypothetical protein A3E30_14290 [Fluviicola sp. RIFCSPHIGHO2_12_FULL_43_24]